MAILRGMVYNHHHHKLDDTRIQPPRNKEGSENYLKCDCITINENKRMVDILNRMKGNKQPTSLCSMDHSSFSLDCGSQNTHGGKLRHGIPLLISYFYSPLRVDYFDLYTKMSPPFLPQSSIMEKHKTNFLLFSWFLDTSCVSPSSPMGGIRQPSKIPRPGELTVMYYHRYRLFSPLVNVSFSDILISSRLIPPSSSMGCNPQEPKQDKKISRHYLTVIFFCPGFLTDLSSPTIECVRWCGRPREAPLLTVTKLYIVTNNSEKMSKKKCILATTSLIILAGMVAMATTSHGDPQAKVAGFQFTPQLDNENPPYFHKLSFTGGNIYDPYGEYSNIFSGNCISTGLGTGAHATSGNAGQLCLQIDEPGTYTLGINPDTYIFGDCNAFKINNPIILPTTTLTIKDCGTPPSNPTATIEIIPNTSSITPQQTTTCVNIHIDSNGTQIQTIGLELTFPPELEIVSFTYENLIGSPTQVLQMGIPDTTSNHIYYGVARTATPGIPVDGTLAKICFTTSEPCTPGTYTLDLTGDTTLIGNLGEPIQDIALIDGTLTVLCEQEPPQGEDIILSWENIPGALCAGEPFCLDVGIEIPATAESNIFLSECNQKQKK